MTPEQATAVVDAVIADVLRWDGRDPGYEWRPGDPPNERGADEVMLSVSGLRSSLLRALRAQP